MKYVTIVFFLLAGLAAPAQIPGITHQKHVDSLFRLLPVSTGNRYIDLLNALSLELSPRNFDSAFRYARKAYLFADLVHYEKGKGVALFNIGNCFYFKNDMRNAQLNYLAALSVLEPYEPSDEIGDLCLQLGAVSQYVSNHRKMALYFLRAKDNFLALNDSLSAIAAYSNLSYAYYFIEITTNSDTLFNKGTSTMLDSMGKYNKPVLEFYLRSPRPRLQENYKILLSEYFNVQAEYHYYKNEDSLALVHYLKGLEVARENRDVVREGMSLLNIANLYYKKLRSLEKGYEYINRAIEILERTQARHYFGLALGDRASMELGGNRYKESERDYLRALKEIDSYLVILTHWQFIDPTSRISIGTEARWFKISIFADLVTLYEKAGNYKQALYAKRSLERERSIQTRDELTRQITKLETDYEDELKRKEIDGLKKDNELRKLRMNQARFIFGGIGGVLLILFLAVMVWIQHRRRITEQKSLVLEQKLLRSQMNPHFIFNSLTNIQNFILTEKPEKASIYLTKFSMLVRNILDNSVEDYVPLEKEIETLEHYLELQKIRFAGKFDYRIHVPDDVDTEVLKIPPMLAQPFIENSIEHGIRHRETPGMIDIRFTIKGNLLVFEVEDNGIGREKAREINIAKDPKHKSMATSLTLERIANLNRKLKEKIRLEITDLKATSGESLGTLVQFAIPV